MHTAVCKISLHDVCFVALHLTLMSYKAFFLFQGRTKAISKLIMRLSTIWFSFSKIHLCDKKKRYEKVKRFDIFNCWCSAFTGKRSIFSAFAEHLNHLYLSRVPHNLLNRMQVNWIDCRYFRTFRIYSPSKY